MKAVKQRPLTTYFIVAYLASWLLAALMIARYNERLDIPGWVHYFVAWGPALGAFVVTAFTEGQGGLRDLFRRITDWRIGWMNALIVLTPLFLLAISVTASAVITGDRPTLSNLSTLDYLGDIGIPAALIVWILSFGLGEEIGWRGYAQHHLEPQRGFLFSVLWIGLIWAFWHLPFFFYKDTFMEIGLVAFPFFLINILPGAVVLGWIYSRTQSLFAVAVWHGLYDFGTASAIDGGMVNVLMSMFIIGWALWIVYSMRRSSKRQIALNHS